LKSVVTEGTATSGIIEGYNIGGKTGTGEQGKRGSGMYTYSFVGYLTIEDPKYIAIALIDKPPKDKIPSAVPIVKNIFEKIIKYKQIKSDSNEPSLFKEAFLLDDFKNKNLKETIKKFNKQNLDYEIVGSGGIYIDSQMPIAGTPVESNSKIYLYVSNSSKEKNDKDKDKDKNLVEVPNVINLNIDQAVEILKKNKFDVIIINESDENENENNNLEVIDQMPLAGVKLETGTQVKLRIK